MLRFPHRVSSLADQIMLVIFLVKTSRLMSLMEICVAYDAQILDMGQAVIHNELALGLLLCSANLDAMSEAIEARCEQTGSALRMQRVNADDYGSWSQNIFQSPLILTLLTNDSAAQPLQAVSALTLTNEHRYGAPSETQGSGGVRR